MESVLLILSLQTIAKNKKIVNKTVKNFNLIHLLWPRFSAVLIVFYENVQGKQYSILNGIQFSKAREATPSLW